MNISKINKSNNSTICNTNTSDIDWKNNSSDTVMGKIDDWKNVEIFSFLIILKFKAIFEIAKSNIEKTLSIASMNLKYSTVNISHVKDNQSYNNLLTKISFVEPGEVNLFFINNKWCF